MGTWLSKGVNGIITVQGDNRPNEIDLVLLDQIIFKVVKEISL
jgi:hypothetical protein